jgi:hypothetical protein
VWFVLLTSWVYRFMQAAVKLAGGEKWNAAFSRQTLSGTGFSAVGHKVVFHGLGVQDDTEFNSG